MARDPGSIWAPLPEAGAPDGYRKTQFIVHSTGDNGRARSVRDNWFARPDVVVESTFIVGLSPDDPTLQLMDSTDNADANGSANQRGISVEVVGDGTGPFTAWQRSELIRLGLWVRREHGIPPRIIPAHTEGGFGWHIMFGAPGPWTSVRGKVCPGDIRIGQLKGDIFPAIFAGADTGGFLMALSDAEQAHLLKRVDDMAALLDWWFVPDTGGGPNSKGEFGKRIRGTHTLVAALAGQSPDIDEEKLAAALAPTLVPAVLAAVAAKNTGLTKDDVEAAIREVLGSLGTPA